MSIKFGTDGWRGIMADTYTFQNLSYCASGTSSYLKSQGQAHRGLLIGYDTRFLSREFAETVAEVSTANGIPTLLCDRPCPTPTASYNMVSKDAGGAVIITASHNPKIWNGFKYKPDYGGSATPEIVAQLEGFISEASTETSVKTITIREAERTGLLEYVDPEPAYLGHIATLVDLQSIRDAGLDLIVDSMHGAGGGYFSKLLSGGSTRVREIRSDPNPDFPGMDQPEPIERNLSKLIEEVSDETADIGLAIDGDADRIGIISDGGKFINPLETYALLAYHQLEVLQRSGALVRSVTTTNMINRLASLYKVPVIEGPVGFKHLGPLMMKEDALIAGEESGGFAFQGNIPERDGILSGLMILDLIVKTQMGIEDLLNTITDKVGPHLFRRMDIKIKDSQKQTIEAKIKSYNPEVLGNKKVTRIEHDDGSRYILDGGYWVMARLSGTEPLLRIYAESDSEDNVKSMLEEIRNCSGV